MCGAGGIDGGIGGGSGPPGGEAGGVGGGQRVPQSTQSVPVAQ